MEVGNEFSITEFIQARSTADIERARELFREYSAWVETDLCFQNFEKELAALPGSYAEPDGRLLLAFHDGKLAGCIGLRKIGAGICEMKRLFVRDQLGSGGIKAANHHFARALMQLVAERQIVVAMLSEQKSGKTNRGARPGRPGIKGPKVGREKPGPSERLAGRNGIEHDGFSVF